MHEEADVCPHCTRDVPNASELSSSGVDSGENIIRFLSFVVVFFFGMGIGLDYLGWWHDWELFPCALVSVVLALVLTALIS